MGKKEKKKKKSFGGAWAERGHRACVKLAKEDPKAHLLPSETCKEFGKSVKSTYNEYTKSGLGSLFGAGGGIDIMNFNMGGGAAPSNLKQTSEQQPYKSAGLRIIKKMAREAI